MDHMGIHYNVWIMLLSFVLSVTASYSALNLICQVPSATSRTRRLWLLTGACALGSGIWAMHFVGILAVRLPFDVRYSPGKAIMSMLIGIVFCYLGLSNSLAQRMTLLRCAASGLLLGAGISVMHYVGMSSMKIEAQIHYYLPSQSISVMIALIASFMSMLLIGRFKDSPGFNRWKLYSALLLGIAISGMHYTSMRASHFAYDSWLGSNPSLLETDVILLMGVSLVTLFMFGISGGAVFLDRHMLERMAYHDPLTGLPNRHGLERYFRNWFLAGRPGAVFFVDLDRFKSINDTLGHDIGDMLLQEVASRLLQSVSPKGNVFRLGGDEFLIAEPDFTPEEAADEAGRILQEVKKSYRIEGNDLYVTASVGISMAPAHGTDRSSLMKAADTALYTSKDSGKNKFSMFDQEMNRHQLRRMSLEKDLRKALAQCEFMVVYQPKWDSLMNVTVGLEALLRWRHPEHGIISPAEFIPIAEETGLIVPITYWMLHEVCSQNMLWHKEGVASVAVSINMSARMFESENLYEIVEEALARSGLSPHYLELEITESIAMNNMEETVAQLSKLRNLGVRVSLDDFGTGFSSLGNLDEIPVNTLKIDQVFIRKSKMHSKKAIISNIIAIARNLNMEVVAEGVETPEQIELLQSLGCRVMQGYYYGRPMPVHELGQWFTDNAAAV
ncbi:putative bifunctional diguanylate cyclase/phosphodiesterase [Paenibacillus rhizophilus]|uniref:Bifunctional diguanylate cyclase/phosphodiesterase n=1 Tax=Paenibacillus rhizophilus TaxID=1850366 RepID=A0A3N9P4H7_9BACL|nr:bifunctional diguanylate cyclase/phosphodiesterase [Paenibacillus rhizophilus]RQW10290.1 bifunctional diguanylate cyclase/phosphodiesterase [Paenibacillus rhizophilus]